MSSVLLTLVVEISMELDVVLLFFVPSHSSAVVASLDRLSVEVLASSFSVFLLVVLVRLIVIVESLSLVLRLIRRMKTRKMMTYSL